MRPHTSVKAAAVVAAASALLLAGCSSDDSGSGSGSGSGAYTTPTDPAQKIELTYWTWAPGMDKVAAVWNKEHPTIHVEVNKQDGGDPAVTKLLTAIKAGSGAPDIMQAEYQKIPTLVASDALADISKDIDPATKSAFGDGSWNAVTLGSDAVYAVPQDSGPMEFYYRADVFEKYGLTVPTTWDDYAKVAEELHQKDPKAYLGTFSSTDAGWFTGLAQQAGASWWGVDGDAWSVDIDSEATQKVATYWGKLVEEGVIDNKPMYTPAWNKALNDGTQVGWISAIWAPGVLSGNAPDTKGQWKMAKLPQWTAGDDATGNWGGSATAVTTQSKNPQYAAEFVTWLNTSSEAADLLVSEGGLYPAALASQKSALTSPPDFFSNQPDFYSLAAEISGTVKPFTYGPNVDVAYSAYNDEFGKATKAKTQQAFGDAVTSMQKTTLDNLKSSGYNVKE
ncbi:ABC transporter substrate-binding protein [Luteimicrobium subarcticum]|uniref:Carbohydrate ABC transporter substrate-binding protein (CUT1 family) n=1 Tax=Luteimicrobium subarcticum TaxID=620910 RepID=A0A2M8W6X1_9MICO|nr:extracellular solute-binding protein [Luteimicrobium subarcticum]PJI86680.1 carbohydrate ABC transporter substrate-binding protein (CUT1 family) [Luteimicrobium subarcticum]